MRSLKPSATTVANQIANFGFWLAIGVFGTIPQLAFADKVILKNGEVVEGVVTDAGTKVHVKRELGGVFIDKKRIKKIEYDKKDDAEASKDDIIIQTGGKILRGKARISEDGRFVLVEVHGQKVSIPRDHVREILWKGKRKKVDTTEKSQIRKRILTLVDMLRSSKKEERKHGEQELAKLGVFAVKDIEEIKKTLKPGDPVLEVFDTILSYHKFKSVVNITIENRIPNVYGRLASKNVETRKDALSDIVIETPGSAPNVLVHFLHFDPEPEIRALCVSQLSMLRSFQELTKVLEVPDGKLRLAAAIALGDHGILAGVPVLIDSLALDPTRQVEIIKNPESSEKQKKLAGTRLQQLNQIRVLADSKLKQFTGQDFGFSPFKPIKSQQRAVELWRAWWQQNGERLLRQSLKLAKSGVVETEQRESARKLWEKGNIRLTQFENMRDANGLPLTGDERKTKFEEAAVFFQQSVQTDPTFVRARLALAYVYYAELREYKNARAQLRAVLNQTSNSGAKEPRCRAFSYLADISMAEGDYKDAELRLFDAIKLASTEKMADALDLKLDLYLNLGHMYLEWAFVRDLQLPDNTVLPAGAKKDEEPSRDGKTPKKEEKPVKDAKKPAQKPGKGKDKADKTPEKVMQTVTQQRLLAAQKAFQKGLAEVYQFDTKYRAQIQDLTSQQKRDAEKAALLQSLRLSLWALKRRSAAFYYGLGRAEVGLKLTRLAVEHFETASKLDNLNTTYSSALRYWREVLAEKTDRAKRSKR